MDEYLYYWPEYDVYCYFNALIDYIHRYGNDYECWRSDEFFELED